jgi:hypothetical protein
VIYQFDKTKVPVYVGQQMDVFIEGKAPRLPQRENDKKILLTPKSS